MDNKNEDFLSFSNDQDILKIIQLETLLFSDRIIKVNKYYFSQERNILITNVAFYNLHHKKLKRRILIQNILGFTVSKTSTEFVLHCKGEDYDYHFLSYRRKKIIQVLNSAYQKLEYSNLLLAYVKDESLLKFVTSQKEKEKNHSFSRISDNLIPINEYLLKNYTNAIQYTKTVKTSYNKQLTFSDTRKSLNIESSDKKNELDEPVETITLARSGTVFQKKKRNNDFFTKKEKNDIFSKFEFLDIIAYGNYSTIQLAFYKPNSTYHILKIFTKEFLIEEEMIESTLLEMTILQSIVSPFIGNLDAVFQTKTHLIFVLPFYQGGDLYHHMKTNRIFDEEKARLYIAQIAIALDELHKSNIIYRDLKPENIMINNDGYLKLIDFGLCKQINKAEKATSFCGTPEFLAPEIITGEGHNECCDWWSLGILLYEMLFGIPPFYNKNLERMYEMIVNCELKFPKKVKISEDAQSLITQLLAKSPMKRLGAINGVHDIEKHSFFKNVDFDYLNLKQIPMPYIPKISDNKDRSHFDLNDIEQVQFNANIHITKENTLTMFNDDDIPEKVLMKLEKNQFQFNQFN